MAYLNSANEDERKLIEQAAAAQTTTPQQSSGAEKAPTYDNAQYNPNAPASGNQSSINTDSYYAAVQALSGASARPVYANSYGDKLNELYNQIVNRPKFQYDVNADPLYISLRDQYAQLGKLAMRDTVAQGAGLTGGYNNTYAQQVGQQTYDAYLQNLTDAIPDLYGQALNQYNSEGDALARQYGMLGDLADDEYGKYRDALGDFNYQRELDYQQQQDALNREFQERQYADALAQQQWERDFADRQLAQQYQLAMMSKSSGGGSSGGGSREAAQNFIDTISTSDIASGSLSAYDIANAGTILNTSGKPATEQQILDALDFATNKQKASNNPKVSYWRNQ